MKKWTHADKFHLRAASGWLGLTSHLEAEKELDEISPQFRTHPSVLKLRYEIFGMAKRWDLALEVAGGMAALLPDDPWGHIHKAFSLHELKRTRRAYNTLIAVVDKHPKEWLMRYNLACYSCQLGNTKESFDWLKKAIAIAGKKGIRLMALEDPDLEPMWKRIGEI